MIGPSVGRHVFYADADRTDVDGASPCAERTYAGATAWHEPRPYGTTDSHSQGFSLE